MIHKYIRYCDTYINHILVVTEYVLTYLNIDLNINVILCIIVPSAYYILASLDAYTKELTIFKFHALNLSK